MLNEWHQYEEHDGTIKNYTCKTCKNNSGRMIRRIVKDSSGEHKEYKICCSTCGHKTAIHWRKELTVLEWNGGAQ